MGWGTLVVGGNRSMGLPIYMTAHDRRFPLA